MGVLLRCTVWLCSLAVAIGGVILAVWWMQHGIQDLAPAPPTTTATPPTG